MAARSIFLTLARNASKGRALLRPFASRSEEIVYQEGEKSGVAEIQTEADKGAHNNVIDAENDDLKSRIFRLRLPKRSVTNVLHRWVSEGRQITISDLRDVSKELRKSQRYKHALEISEWMVAHDEFKLADSDYAVRIDLLTKVFGIDAAERYFRGLPASAKTSETYTALLHSYAALKLIEKAEDLFEKIKKENLSVSALTYNELMTLYMSVGQLEKVSLIVEELKAQKVAPDIFTYNLWISSCAAAFNIDVVRRILDEMNNNYGFSESWLRYVNLVKIYITSSCLVESDFTSLVENEKAITQREWITYDFLIILYGGMGNKERIDQIWKSLRMAKQKMISRNYACVISSYLMLGQLKEVREIIDQWRQSTTTEFDNSICIRLVKSFAEVGLTDKAAALRIILIERGCDHFDEL